MGSTAAPATETKIGLAAAFDQFAPAEVLEFAVAAERNGFSGVIAAERFQPWVPEQGHAAFTWTALGALGQITEGELLSGVSVPGYRWHPAQLAQASATLAALYPGRHILAIGSGEAIDEHVSGGYWPETAERIDRMFEAVELIQKLFTASLAGKDAKHSGRHFKLESTRLWTMPQAAPPILISTAGPVTAKRAGRVADGLLIDGAPFDRIPQLFSKFEEGSTEAKRVGGIRAVRLHLSWASSAEQATENALRYWPNGALRFPRSDIRSPFEFEQLARMVRPEDFEGRVLISPDPAEHLKLIQSYVDLGFDRIYLHNVGPNQLEWIDCFGSEVLPRLKR